jgi:hypothetical protein
MISGHCECRRIQFEVNGDINDFSHCHCSQCRRLHGAAFATFAGVERNKFRYVSGESDVKVYLSSPTHKRLFCSVCGSNILVALEEEPESLYLSMSAIDGNPPLPPGYHIFVGSKAVWHEISDDLEQHGSEPPE